MSPGRANSKLKSPEAKVSLDCPKEYKAEQNEQEQRAAGDRASEVIRTLDGALTLWGLV